MKMTEEQQLVLVKENLQILTAIMGKESAEVIICDMEKKDIILLSEKIANAIGDYVKEKEYPIDRMCKMLEYSIPKMSYLHGEEAGEALKYQIKAMRNIEALINANATELQ